MSQINDNERFRRLYRQIEIEYQTKFRNMKTSSSETAIGIKAIKEKCSSHLEKLKLLKNSINDEEENDSNEIFSKIMEDFNQCVNKVSGNNNLQEMMLEAVQARNELSLCSQICTDRIREKKDEEISSCIRNCFENYSLDLNGVNDNLNIISKGKNL